jgi:hypothetical protein
MILNMLIKGVSMRAIFRTVGGPIKTVTKLLGEADALIWHVSTKHRSARWREPGAG